MPAVLHCGQRAIIGLSEARTIDVAFEMRLGSFAAG